MKDRYVIVCLLISFVIILLVGSLSEQVMALSNPTPTPAPTVIQFPETDMDRTPLPPMTATPGIEFYVPMPTPVPFADMPLLYFYDEAHDTDCWVTFNQMAISCLRRPAFWPCEARAER